MCYQLNSALCHERSGSSYNNVLFTKIGARQAAVCKHQLWARWSKRELILGLLAATEVEKLLFMPSFDKHLHGTEEEKTGGHAAEIT